MALSFESASWNACLHRLDLGLCSHPKEFWGNGVSTHVNSNGKNPLYREKFFSEENQTHDAASSGTSSLTHYQRAIPASMVVPTPHGAGSCSAGQKQTLVSPSPRVVLPVLTTLIQVFFFLARSDNNTGGPDECRSA